MNILRRVPLFNYTPESFEGGKGDEFYEIGIFAHDGSPLLSRDEVGSFNTPQAAIEECAARMNVRDGSEFGLVQVYGDRYPDGSEVPAGGVVWDSKVDPWPTTLPGDEKKKSVPTVFIVRFDRSNPDDVEVAEQNFPGLPRLDALLNQLRYELNQNAKLSACGEIIAHQDGDETLVVWMKFTLKLTTKQLVAKLQRLCDVHGMNGFFKVIDETPATGELI